MLGRTLLGINESIQMDKWVLEHKTELEETIILEDILKLVFPIMMKLNGYRKIEKYEDITNLFEVMLLWIKGCSFDQVLQYMHNKNVRIYKRRSFKEVTIEDVVELCETCFGYQCSLLISALSEIVKEQLELPVTISLLNKLARKMKYGLTNESEIMLYEMGFADRVVAQKISAINPQVTNKLQLKNILESQYDEVEKLLSSYPSYFQVTLKQILKRK